ncbi:MAG: amylo-alpha-1,6-glucosidase [Candidatus Izemoplasmatales bacterium]|jgi:predicted glycogen debranching enzyme|nr:amylo-alpha-1,6-glucosidase [Candidatus Izemoplasmatales bacterium]
MEYRFDRNDLRFQLDSEKEWVLSNGIGGYMGTSIVGSNERLHHGLLIASKTPPIDRNLLLSKIEESFLINDKSYSLVNQKYEGYEEETLYLSSFILEEVPTFYYEDNTFRLTKKLSPYYGHNTLAISYEIESSDFPLVFQIKPLFNYRNHSDVSTIDDLHFDEELNGQTLHLTKGLQRSIFFNCSKGKYLKNDGLYTNPFVYPIGIATGDSRTDVQYQPYTIQVMVPAKSKTKVEVICSDEEIPSISATEIINQYVTRLQTIVFNAGYETELLNNLVIASDQFIVKRNSTNAYTVLAGLPWFTDWGRDTMIAFEGLLLVTKRFEEAKEVLLSFAKYEKNGLIPNMFPDEGSLPLYNTVDASLWYIHAIYKYYEYTKDIKFIQNELYAVMKSIVYNYKIGTDFFIGMDSDCLIHAGSGLDQVTWMDVRINGEVITPRHGKPVEINALWYNALRIMDIVESFTDNPSNEYLILARKVKKSFLKKFWNTHTNCLYDVIDEDDSSIRPNQLFAISLPFSMISKTKAKTIISIVEKELVDIYGIRTLAKSDPRFISTYQGDIVSRDHAYHMGTSWGFLLGTYFDSVKKTYPHSKKQMQNIISKVSQIESHLFDGCINGYAEVFDGLNGIKSKGCYTQAWSVAEILRVVSKLY